MKNKSFAVIISL